MTKYDSIMKDIPLRSRHLGLAAIIPFGVSISASRVLMLTSMLGQAPSLLHGEEKIVQSGYEREYGRSAKTVKFANDSKVVSIHELYPMSRKQTEVSVLYYDMTTRLLGRKVIKPFRKDHQYFGFRQELTDEFHELQVGSLVRGGTVIAKPATVKENGGYAYGVNLVTALVSSNGVVADSVVMSDTAAKKLAFTIQVDRTLTFGGDVVPCNTYGDEKNYKVVPDRGDTLRDDGIICATRTPTNMNAITELSAKSLMEVDPYSDNVTYAYGPDDYIQNGDMYDGSRTTKAFVTDVHVTHSNFGATRSSYLGTEKQVYGYWKTSQQYMNSVVRSATSKNVVGMKLSKPLHSDVVDHLIMSSPKVKKVVARRPIDSWTVKVTIEYMVIPGVQSKITPVYGDKGVIGKIVPESEMPITSDGVRVECIMDGDSTVGRTNSGRLDDVYMGAVSRKVQRQVRLNVKNNVNPKVSWTYVMGLLKILNTQQYVTYSKLDTVGISNVLKDICDNEFYIHIDVDVSKRMDEVIFEGIKDSIYQPLNDYLMITTPDGLRPTYDRILVGPMYVMALFKLGDTTLATSTPNINIYGIPVPPSKEKKYNLPYTNTPLKSHGETETRLYAAYGDVEALPELKLRASSMENMRVGYRMLLTAKRPSNIKYLVPSAVKNYDGDLVVKMVKKIMSNSGIEMIYIKE